MMNLDTYINHIYQIWYESINYLKQYLNWEGVFFFLHNVKLKPTAHLLQLTREREREKTNRGPGSVAACSRPSNQANYDVMTNTPVMFWIAA